MIISIDTKRTFDNIQQLFIINTLNKLGLEENFFNLIKSIFEKPTENIILKWKTERFPPKIRTKIKMSVLVTSIQHCSGGSHKYN